MTKNERGGGHCLSACLLVLGFLCSIVWIEVYLESGCCEGKVFVLVEMCVGFDSQG